MQIIPSQAFAEENTLQNDFSCQLTSSKGTPPNRYISVFDTYGLPYIITMTARGCLKEYDISIYGSTSGRIQMGGSLIPGLLVTFIRRISIVVCIYWSFDFHPRGYRRITKALQNRLTESLTCGMRFSTNSLTRTRQEKFLDPVVTSNLRHLAESSKSHFAVHIIQYCNYSLDLSVEALASYETAGWDTFTTR